MDRIYTRKYEELERQIESLNQKNARGYDTFEEYLISDNKMLSYFEELKKLEKKFPKLHVDSYDAFYHTISNQLNKIYNNLLYNAFEKENQQTRINELNKLRDDVNNSYNYNFDDIVKEISRDLEDKIENVDRYKLEEIEDKYSTKDPLYNEVVEFVVQQGKASSSLIQRRFRLGYNRACELLDLMEKQGIIGPATGSMKPRDVLVGPDNSNYNVAEHKIRKLIKLSSEEYRMKKLNDNRKNKTISEIMKEYNIDSEYNDNNDISMSLKNSLITCSTKLEDKTNFINSIIKYCSPDKTKLVILDMELVELMDYYGLPHLITPIMTTSEKFDETLKKMLLEMEDRYNLLLKKGVKSIKDYNNLDDVNKLPNIVIIVNEIFNLLDMKKIYDNLIKLLLNGERVGIKIVVFSKLNHKELKLGTMESLINIYSKYDFKKIIDGIPETNEYEINDEMNGFDFEEYTAELLKANGFEDVEVTNFSGDFGVDIIAFKDDIKYAIQCKKYSSPVGIKAVQEVIGSKSMNDCHVAVVLTNNTFTKSAKELAKKNNVLLWDGEKLQELIENYK